MNLVLLVPSAASVWRFMTTGGPEMPTMKRLAGGRHGHARHDAANSR